MKLHFKLKENVPSVDKRRLFDGLSNAGANRVYPLFEESDDPALSSLYVLQCDRPDQGLFKDILDHSSIVEFLDSPVTRTLKPMG